MAFTMGFSAGVMVLVSFVELLQQEIKSVGFAYEHITFFAGMCLMDAIDVLIPHNYIMEEGHTGVAAIGVITGMIVMALSLTMLNQ